MPSAKSSKKTSAKPAKTIAGHVSPVHDEARAQVLEQYQSAVTALQQGDYKAAHPALEKLLATAPPEFIDRIRMYLAACVAQSTKKSATFETLEERYDYAIALLNDGQYEDAREHFAAIADENDTADYAFYGLAVLASITGDAQSCLEQLTEAIRLNSQNRILARSDSDFSDMTDDPRFTELLYPEA